MGADKIDRIEVHGIKFIRHDSCKRCGACEKKSCPHFKMVNGLSTCMTYGKGDYLEWKCYEFPDSPFCGVILKGICGYRFEPVTEEDDKKYKEFLKIWKLDTR